jgi:drug/metabolite transporter (DMT)-like permease
MLWAVSAGTLFSLLNALMRALALTIDPFQAQFLRYFFGLVVLLPIVWHRGWSAYRPRHIGGQFVRGAAHTLGLCLWFSALPKIALADTTAIGFTTPIFIMIGAKLAFGEPMRWERWLATAAGVAGVLIVVGPKLSASAGLYHLVMLSSAPVFAASFLITKALTRYETTGTILVWQAISVASLSLPLALLHWQSVDAIGHARRHLRDAIGQVPRPRLVGAAGPGAVRGRADRIDTGGRRTDLCRDGLAGATRIARRARPNERW